MTRRLSWWPGGVKGGDVHIHHLVWGICLMMLCGFLAFAAPLKDPWWDVVAIGFGVGAGLALDEFALFVRLEDVYWTREGRTSFDAVVVAFSFAALVVIGTRPFGLADPESVWETTAVVAVILGLVCISAAKGRVLVAVIAVFIPVVGLIGAMRLARPSSPWARRFYGDRQLDLARQRYAPTRALARLGSRLADIVVGAPSDDAQSEG
jgi:hypothetical protein